MKIEKEVNGETEEFSEDCTHLIPGKLLNGTQSRIRELHVDELFVIIELVLSGQVVERIGREAGSHLFVITLPVIPYAELLCFLLLLSLCVVIPFSTLVNF